MKAIPFAGIEGWLNSKPLELSMLRGKVVLLDFWTYSCINCIRTLPHIKQLWEKYKECPFVIIGVHTPEFAFEKKKENVEQAVRKQKIEYPIALDSENITWKLYGNRYWPKQVLISAEGEIVYGHIGEGGYEEIEENVIQQLQSIGVNIKFRRETSFRDMFRFAHKQEMISPESYIGSIRGAIASGIVCQLEGCSTYKDPGQHEPDAVYLEGDWKQEYQYAVHHGKKGYLLMRFSAKSVNLVLDAEKNTECSITIDGKPLTKYNAGSDIFFDKDQSKIIVDKPGMYNLYNFEKTGEHEIKIETEGALKAYVFTFG